MNIDICKKCKMYPDYFLHQFYKGYKKDIVKHYFYGYKNPENEKTNFDEITYPCLIIETSNKDYFSIGEKPKFLPEEIFSHKNIEPDKEQCPYYIEHQIQNWNKK